MSRTANTRAKRNYHRDLTRRGGHCGAPHHEYKPFARRKDRRDRLRALHAEAADVLPPYSFRMDIELTHDCTCGEEDDGVPCRAGERKYL